MAARFLGPIGAAVFGGVGSVALTGLWAKIFPALRDAHLAQIRMPVLCFNGTQDPLCRRDLMEKALEKLSWQMYWLEGATHSFRVKDLKEVTEFSRAWLSRLA